MKLLFKVILLFLIVFNFKIPIINYSATLTVILASLYFLIKRKAIPFTYFTYKYIVIILIGTLILSVINLSVTTLHGTPVSIVFRRLILQFYTLCCLIYCFPILIEKKTEAWTDTMQVICFTFALQGAIHLSGFLFTPIGDFLLDLKSDEFKEFLFDPQRNIDKFRGYALAGSIFFELPAAYGVACIMFFRLQLIENQHHINGWKSFVVIFLLITGIALSGRTGFVGLFIGLCIYLLFMQNRLGVFIRNLGKYALIIGIGFIAYILLNPAQRQNLNEELLPFAFEAYYSYVETGKFSTKSTDALENYHYFSLEEETILKGHGVNSDDIAIYSHTDSGYMNNLIFGGILYLLCLIIYQSLYFISPLVIASKKSALDFTLFLALFGYVFLLEYKATSLGTQFLTEALFLFIGFTYLLKNYEISEQN